MLDKLEAEKNQYIVLREELEKIIISIERGCTNGISASNLVTSFCSIDNNRIDNGKLSDSIESLEHVKNQIIRVILPSIDVRIGRINDRVEQEIIKKETEKKVSSSNKNNNKVIDDARVNKPKPPPGGGTHEMF